jgi:hypothetical protein
VRLLLNNIERAHEGKVWKKNRAQLSNWIKQQNSIGSSSGDWRVTQDFTIFPPNTQNTWIQIPKTHGYKSKNMMLYHIPACSCPTGLKSTHLLSLNAAQPQMYA